MMFSRRQNWVFLIIWDVTVGSKPPTLSKPCLLMNGINSKLNRESMLFTSTVMSVDIGDSQSWEQSYS